MSPIRMSSVMFTAVVLSDITSCHPSNGVSWMTDVNGVQRHCVGIVG